MKKGLLLFLALALLLPATLFVSCGKKPAKEIDTAESQTAEKDETAEALGFGRQSYNQEVRILLNNAEAPNEKDFSVDAAAADSDSVSSETYRRNLICEDYLGISITYTPEAGNWNSGMAEKLRNLIATGSCDYDLVAMGLNTGIIGGYIDIYQNILEMDQINLNHSWWVQDMIEQNSINDQLYFLSGDACVTTYSYIGCVFANLDVAATFNVDVDFYELVESGDWTMDEFFRLFKLVSADDGDGIFDPTKDTYGWCNWKIGVRLMWSCCDMNLIERQSDGTFALRTGLDDRMTNLVAAIKEAYDDPASSYASTDQQMVDAFVGNHVFLTTAMLARAEDFRTNNIKSAFAILPMPKYNAEQTDYISTNMPAYNALFFPISIKSPKLSAQIAEFMGWYGQKNIIPAYYDKVLKYQQNNNEANIAMLDLIREKLRITPNESYGVIGGLDSVMYLTQATPTNTTDTGFYSVPTSVWKQKYSSISGRIDSYIYQYYK